MQVIQARTVSEALSMGLHTIRIHGTPQESRVGTVLVSPRPIMTVYSDPTNRVLFSPVRNANPFFHVMEALWMLAGRNDLPWLTRFNKQFASYSDDGGATQPGAYGYRWRNHFGHDQLLDIILELKHNPQTRRAVLAMWDGGAREDWQSDGQPEERAGAQPGDFFNAVAGSADVPCNTHAYFDMIDGRLNMTVCCRSNDIIWGAYGANAVHFSFLLEYLAAMIGVPMGVYRQFSNNYHLYTNVVPRGELMPMARDVEDSDAYLAKESHTSLLRKPVEIYKVPLVVDPENFDEDLAAFMAGWGPDSAHNYRNTFFTDVAIPMYESHALYREKNYDAAIDRARDIKAEDWHKACVEWLQRRKIKAEADSSLRSAASLNVRHNRPSIQPERRTKMEQLDFLYSAGETKRFHTVPVLREQNIAAHSWHVAMLLFIVFGQDEPGIRTPLLMAGLTHDAAEWRVGDLPAPAKRNMDERLESTGEQTFREAWGEMEQDILKEVAFDFENYLQPHEALALNFCDSLDGIIYCTRERMLGNKFIAECFFNFSRYINDLLPQIKRQWPAVVYTRAEDAMKYVFARWEQADV